MKKFLIATALALGVASPAFAQDASCTTDPITGNTFCDPAAFHVSSPGATGQDPVLLNGSNSFTITEVGNHSISQPVRILILEPLGSLAPTITSGVFFDPGGAVSIGATSFSAAQAFDTTNGLFDGPVVTLSAGQDVGKAFNLPGADASVSFTNIVAEYTKLGLVAPTKFNIFSALIPISFTSNADFLTLNGDFGIGSIIAPIAVNVEIGNNGKLKVTTFDTAWTNTGFVNQLSSPVPEPSTWLLGLCGFGFVAAMTWIRKRKTRFAIEA